MIVAWLALALALANSVVLALAAVAGVKAWRMAKPYVTMFAPAGSAAGDAASSSPYPTTPPRGPSSPP